MMTKAPTLDFTPLLKASFAALLLAATALLASAAWAQTGPRVLGAERAQGLVGEQADGYLGIPPQAGASADLRARVNQINIQRRAAYTQQAQDSRRSVEEMAAAAVCYITFPRIGVGERYQDQAGAWRQRAAGEAVLMPSFCP
jgi:uncharacterized protein